MIQSNIIQQAKDLPMVDMVGHYVALKRNGNNYVGNCPFHDEKTPSFNVHQTKGYNCFGCGASGANAIDFIMAIENISFPDAVIKAASLGGVNIDNSTMAIPFVPRPKEAVKQQAVNIIPLEALRANLKAFKQNNLYVFIANRYGQRFANEAFQSYQTGSCVRLGNGTTLFVQKDKNGHFRHCKAIAYNPSNGKRNKELDPIYIGKSILAKHSNKSYNDINLVQCYFGEHLLNGNTMPVAICESEKTSMICSLFYKQFVWLATGGKNGCRWYSKEVCKILAGREIFLFPDVDGFDDWQAKAVNLEAYTGSKVTVIDIMGGEPAPEGKTKYDIADLLIDSGKKPVRQLEVVESDIESMPCIFIYKDYQAQTVCTKQGNYIDVLFDASGGLMPIDRAVEGFDHGLFNGLPALMAMVPHIRLN